MANLKNIKLQIKSVQNTEKTTKAMKLVSNVKLKKAKEAALKSRVYEKKINEVLSQIANEITHYDGDAEHIKYLDNDRKVEIVDIIFISSDKGLCGGFNHATIKAVKILIEEYKAKKIKVRLRAVGKKAIDYFTFQGVELLKAYQDVSSHPSYEKASEIIFSAIKDFDKGNTDKIVLVHNSYKNMIAQELVVQDIVPVDKAEIDHSNQVQSLMEIEPASRAEQILEKLLHKYFEYNMYYALIDSLAAEHSARMQAMDSATNNSKEKVRLLNLAYNKARQSSITTELIEIISGVEAMK